MDNNKIAVKGIIVLVLLAALVLLITLVVGVAHQAAPLQPNNQQRQSPEANQGKV